MIYYCNSNNSICWNFFAKLSEKCTFSQIWHPFFERTVKGTEKTLIRKKVVKTFATHYKSFIKTKIQQTSEH